MSTASIPSSQQVRRIRKPSRKESEPQAAAQQAKLRYVTDADPGILRSRAGKGFSYRDPDGRLVKDKSVLARIRSLAIPPAWKHVWICRDEHGHLQATGRDARGRKQYRYHPRWRAVRDETKFDRLLSFAKALPTIRKAVVTDLSTAAFTKRKVVAAVVKFLDLSLIRVGNEEYARTNQSYGLTTMRDEHASILGSSVEFRFRGKGGVKHKVEVRDRKLARVVAKCQAIPGQILFQYKDDAGEFRALTSTDVNEYLREVAGDDFSAKDFRTWAGTVLAACCLKEMHDTLEEAGVTKSTLARAIERVAERLGNTPTVCRKSYIHPAVCESYLAGSLLDSLSGKSSIDGLDESESVVRRFLERLSDSR
jgi:DNA topoisomerase I